MTKYNQGGVTAWIVTGIVAALLVALFAYNVIHQEPNQHTEGDVWVSSMTQGAADAPNRLVEYTDHFCKYCADFAEQAESDKFQTEYIDSGKVLLESRVVTVLAGEKSPNAEQGAEAAFCAADQGKYWEYSAHIVPRIKKEFFDKGIGVNTVPAPKPIAKLPISYFETSAQAVGMDVKQFSQCIKDETHQQTIAENTQKAIQMGVTGLPYIAINDYTTSGFQAGWEGMELVLKAGQVD